MAAAPTPKMLAELRRLHKEASDVSYSHDEYLTLMFMAAVELERGRAGRETEACSAGKAAGNRVSITAGVGRGGYTTDLLG